MGLGQGGHRASTFPGLGAGPPWLWGASLLQRAVLPCRPAQGVVGHGTLHVLVCTCFPT